MTQNALAVLGGMKISTLAKKSKYADQELGAGIAAPFAVIGFKGGKWSIRHRGITHLLERKDAQGRSEGPVPFLDLVILFAASHHSKVYYAKQYQDGDDDIPDCWSTDGVKPDQAAPKKQNSICATCRWNEFGSRMNQATGAKGKACSDTRRMAVVPYKDIPNEIMGGPMLLRVPPASLGNVGAYSDLLKANSVPYSAVATRVGFDNQEAYPKMTFEPYEALTDGQMELVLKAQAHPLVERIVQEQVENMVAQPGSEQGVNVPPAARGTDPGPIPAHLDRTTNGSGSPQKAQEAGPGPFGARPEDAPKSAPAPAAAPAAEALTPEQLEIQELRAKLAAAEAKPSKGPTRKRTQPVAPQATAEPHSPVEAAPEDGEEDGSGSGAVVQPAGADPALASISARLSKILS
jgi:hypothetical protein